MKPLQDRKHLLPALLAAVLCGCSLYAAPIHTGEKIMSELINTMQPVCFGRLVIEIPSMAKIEGGWDQKIDDTKIVSLDTPSPNRKSFDTKVAQRERQLKMSPHDTDGVLFNKGIHLTPDSELLVFREKKTSTRIYIIDAFFWRPKFEYLFHTETGNKYLAEDIDGMTQLVKSFIPMPTTDLMSIPPGLCIEHGVLSGSKFRGESVAIAGLINEYPGVAFSFQTESTSKPPEEPRMIARIERSFGMGDNIGKEITAATKFLRKGKRTLNGQPGEEIVAVMTIDGETSIEANAEFYGEPNSLDKPDIYVSLSDQTHDDNTHKSYSKNLTEKEFLALWDALLNGIKPRPKNQWGADSNKK